MTLTAVLTTLLGPGSATAATTTFDTAGEHTYTVPAGVTRIDIVAIGGTGGATQHAADLTRRSGGHPARVTATLDVTPGQVLRAVVGGSASGMTPGANGGASVGTNTGPNPVCAFKPGAGGGASDVRTVPVGTAGSVASRVLVAGGGGGSGSAEAGFSGTPASGGGPRGMGGQGLLAGHGAFDGTAGAGGTGGGTVGGDASGGPGAVGPPNGGGGCGGGGGGGYGGGGGGGGAGNPVGGGGGGGGSLVPGGGQPYPAPRDSTPSVVITDPGTPAPSDEGTLHVTTDIYVGHFDVPFTNCPDTCLWCGARSALTTSCQDTATRPSTSVDPAYGSQERWGSNGTVDGEWAQAGMGSQPPRANLPAELGEPFVLTNFIHWNTPIRGSSPTAIGFQTKVAVQAAAGPPALFDLTGPKTVPFNFLETDNSSVCNPLIQRSPVPCDDIFEIETPPGVSTIKRQTAAAGVTWRLEFLGWPAPGGGFEGKIITQEAIDTRRPLYGQITVDTNPTASALAVDAANPAAPVLTLTTSPTPQTGGTVAFTDGGTPIPGCTAVPVPAADGTTTCTATGLAPGARSLGGDFLGGVGYAASQAAPVTHTVPAPPAGAGGGTPGTGSTPGTVVPKPPANKPKPRFRTVRLGRALREGLLGTLTGGRPGSLRLTARLGTSTVASGKGTVRANGTARIRLRFTRAARVRFAKSRRVRLTVRGRGLPATRVTLRR